MCHRYLSSILVATVIFQQQLWIAGSQVDQGSLASCELHPAFRRRIQEDLKPYIDKGGITWEDIQLISRTCKENDPCNDRLVRVVIDGGVPYLTSLPFPDGPANLVGFNKMLTAYLLDILEVSLSGPPLPNVAFALCASDYLVDGFYDPANDTMVKVPERNPVVDDPKCPKDDTVQPGKQRLLPVQIGYAKLARRECEAAQVGLLLPHSAGFRCDFSHTFDDMASNVAEFDQVPWEQRTEVAFTRFTSACNPVDKPLFEDGSAVPLCIREQLDKLSQAHPDLLDARAVRSQEEHVPLPQQVKYRYHVYADGYGTSYKMERYLLMGSALLRHESLVEAYWHGALEAGVHYVPFWRANASDILQAVQWCRTHDKEAWQIAQNARAFALQHLSRPARLCYVRTLLQELGKAFKYTPSCKHHKMCVKVEDVLRFVGHFKKENPYGCDLHEELRAMHRSSKLAGSSSGSSSSDAGSAYDVGPQPDYDFKGFVERVGYKGMFAVHEAATLPQA